MGKGGCKYAMKIERLLSENRAPHGKIEQKGLIQVLEGQNNA
jgi:hypothetical protein